MLLRVTLTVTLWCTDSLLQATLLVCVHLCRDGSSVRLDEMSSGDYLLAAKSGREQPSEDHQGRRRSRLRPRRGVTLALGLGGVVGGEGPGAG